MYWVHYAIEDFNYSETPVPAPEVIRMNLGLWILQGLLAVVFGGVGLMHLIRSKTAFDADPNFRWTRTMSQSSIKSIGAAELAGALGLVVPAAAGVLMGLVPLAALCLGVLMAGAAATHRRLKEPVAPTLVLSLLSLMVAVGRGWLVPL
jgi:uncharacterized membrane protein